MKPFLVNCVWLDVGVSVERHYDKVKNLNYNWRNFTRQEDEKKGDRSYK